MADPSTAVPVAAVPAPVDPVALLSCYSAHFAMKKEYFTEGELFRRVNAKDDGYMAARDARWMGFCAFRPGEGAVFRRFRVFVRRSADPPVSVVKAVLEADMRDEGVQCTVRSVHELSSDPEHLGPRIDETAPVSRVFAEYTYADVLVDVIA